MGSALTWGARLPALSHKHVTKQIGPFVASVEHLAKIDEVESRRQGFHLDVAGRRVARGEQVLAIRQKEIEEQCGGIWMRSLAGNADAYAMRHYRRQVEIIDGRAVGFHLLKSILINAETHRHFARRRQARH